MLPETVKSKLLITQFLEKHIIVRAHLPGVFFGICKDIMPNPDGTVNVILAESRQLWEWWTPVGQGVAGVAEHGLAQNHSVHVGALRSELQHISGVFQMDICTAVAVKSIQSRASVQS